MSNLDGSFPCRFSSDEKNNNVNNNNNNVQFGILTSSYHKQNSGTLFP